MFVPARQSGVDIGSLHHPLSLNSFCFAPSAPQSLSDRFFSEVKFFCPFWNSFCYSIICDKSDVSFVSVLFCYCHPAAIARGYSCRYCLPCQLSIPLCNRAKYSSHETLENRPTIRHKLKSRARRIFQNAGLLDLCSVFSYSPKSYTAGFFVFRE